MNIGIIAPSLLRNTGGLEKQVEFLVNNINNYVNKNFNFVYYFDLKNKNSNLIKKFKNIEFYSSDQFETTKFKIQKDFALKKIDLFILFFSWSEVEFWFNIFNDLKNIPFIYSERTEPKLITQRWDSLKREKLLKRANGIHFFFDDYAQDHKHYLQKILIQENISKKLLCKKRFLYVGSINKFPKQTHIILDIFKKNKNINLTICGKDDENLLNTHYDNIFYRGTMPPDKIEEAYKNADCLLVSSKYEGCPNVVIEGKSFNLPIIGFDECSGVRNLLKNYSHGILVNSPEMFEKEILKFASIDDSFFYKWAEFFFKIGKEH